MMIIGICGAAGSGKDAAASCLIERHGYALHKFAAPLYEAVSVMTGLTVDQLMDRDLKERPIAHFGNKSPRELLQSLGTDWGRDMVAQDVWLQAAAARAVEPRCVFTDMRFPNEAEWVLSEGGQVWRVERDVPGNLACKSAHKSEAGIPDHLVSLVIDNSGTLGDLHAAVAAAVA
jgi:hypothetical protein